MSNLRSSSPRPPLSSPPVNQDSSRTVARMCMLYTSIYISSGGTAIVGVLHVAQGLWRCRRVVRSQRSPVLPHRQQGSDVKVATVELIGASMHRSTTDLERETKTPHTMATTQGAAVMGRMEGTVSFITGVGRGQGRNAVVGIVIRTMQPRLDQERSTCAIRSGHRRHHRI